ncbi:L-carnitine dehydratase/bile acid-inducible protein F [Rhodopseudomonas palustris BisB5]|uniref:L-carnitine dehydratase/bile acid-inducible protein F n=1 Tax=Rhodopseudomonas palustris (strain BisB5) TaxID=316057 RepID=Q139V0_RHOPS|nr:L-carnitine dehydratase/bile acid-inducible protein F [Rhodopseudomonas palustris BisB5]
MGARVRPGNDAEDVIVVALCRIMRIPHVQERLLMQTPRELLAELWASVGGDGAALDRVTLTGEEPQLPSSFRGDAAAQVSIAASGLAAAEIWRMRSGRAQTVSVDTRHAAIECRSERYLRRDGEPPPPMWDPIAGVYQVSGGRYVRLHTNFPHHRAAVCEVLGCKSEREAVQAALLNWDGEAFETAAYRAGGVVALMRSREEWQALPQASALDALPLVEITKIGDAAPKPWPAGERPLAGLRVLDLSRVIAGPVAGRTLAAHGAEVMLVSSERLPSIPWLVIDTGRGKLSSFADLTTTEGHAALRDLLTDADIFSQGYRPQSLAALGFSPEEAATLNPGIVYVSLSAYGRGGPWAARRGFDSLVQCATGFNHAEGQAAGVAGPKELPMQVLDHATGYLMAFGAMIAKARQAREGGSWHVQVSLARTGKWLWEMGRLAEGLAAPDIVQVAAAPFLDQALSSFGQLTAVRHAAMLSETRAYWARPAVPLGTDPPRWPAQG